MWKFLFPAAIAAVVLVIGIVASSDAKKPTPPTLQVTQVLGKDVKVPPGGGPVRAVARCPKGYVVTGGGTLHGALESAYQVTTTSGQGWEASYFNPSDTSTFSGSVLAVCARGKGPLRVSAAGTSQRRRAEDALRDRLGLQP
jgi:hypothetical protein